MKKKEIKKSKLEVDIEKLDQEIQNEISFIQKTGKIYRLSLEVNKYQGKDVEFVVNGFANELVEKYSMLPYILIRENYELAEKIKTCVELIRDEYAIIITDIEIELNPKEVSDDLQTIIDEVNQMAVEKYEELLKGK